jgi:DNA replication protein DnaC
VTDNAVTECGCRKVRRWKSVAPPAYRRFNLNRVVPDPARHPGQAPALAALREDPTGSYLFAGKNRVGKSLMAWCLARQAVCDGRRIAAVNLAVLLDEYRAFEKPIGEDESTPKKPAVTAGDISSDKGKWFVLLQEFDKPRATEYACERLFELIDAAFNYEHQLVITSNLDLGGLIAHWSKVAPRYGHAILSRVAEKCNQVNMF